MPSFQVPVLGFADGFLSPFPDSLPQLFLRCLPCALAFGLSPSVPLSFVRFSSGSGYSAFCFFLSSFFPFPPLSCFSGAASPLSLPCFSPFLPTWFPVSSFPVLRTRLSVCFLSSLPVSLPQLFHRCFPFAFAFGLFPYFHFLSSASVRF